MDQIGTLTRAGPESASPPVRSAAFYTGLRQSRTLGSFHGLIAPRPNSAQPTSVSRHAAARDRLWRSGATVGLVAMFSLSGAATLASPMAGDTDVEVRRVVILNSTDPYLPAFLALDAALREVIRACSRAPADLYAEALDMHRFPPELLGQDVVALLRKKYRDLRVDVVVADAAIALDFAQRHRAEIWPGAAIVFNSVPAAELRERTLEPRTIGIPVRLEFGQTLDLALRLRPETRRIAVVSGAATPTATSCRSSGHSWSSLRGAARSSTWSGSRLPKWSRPYRRSLRTRSCST
jgi:hypothetical protein